VNRTIDSPFLDREILGEKPAFEWRERRPDLDSASPFVSAFMTDDALAETGEASYTEAELQETFADSDFESEPQFERFDLLLEAEPFAEELDDLDELSDEDGYDPASNEGATDMELLGEVEEQSFESSSVDFDAELFQQLVPLGPAVEQALVSAQIASGVRDANALTDFIFFVRHPALKGTRLGKGQEALMAEWRQIRDGVAAPALARMSAPAAAPSVADTPAVALGALTSSRPGGAPFHYAFTPEDLLWTARFINGEAGGRDDPQNRCVIWAMFNRYAFFRDQYPAWGKFSDFVRLYSTPLQPYLKKYEQVARWVKECNSTFDNKECKYQPTTSEYYPGTSVRKGQLKKFLKLQKTPWSELSATSRKLATLALSGDVPNPIGNVTDFADTAVYFQRKHGHPPKTRAEWESYTQAYALKKKKVWRPQNTPYDEFGNNVMFTTLRAKDYPPAEVSRPTGRAPAQLPTPTQPTPFTSQPTQVTPQPTRIGGDPSRELLYDGTTPAPGTVETRRSYPTNPPIKGDASNRNRMLYDNVINQFAVRVNPRYKHRKNSKGKTSTFCNIFCWDVTRAMNAEIPHWISKSGSGEPTEHLKGGELSANATFDWLHEHGGRFGWRQIADMATAQGRANAGHPTIAILKKPGSIGHVAVIRPGEVTGKGAAMAQAGKHNLNNTRVYTIFSPKARIEFWTSSS
jgi:hypothetical protein